MNIHDPSTFTWRGKLRMALLRVVRDPILTSRVDGAEVRLNYVERLLARTAHGHDRPVPGEIEVPEAKSGEAGRIQALEQKLEALQTRVDVLTLTVSRYRTEAADAMRRQSEESGNPHSSADTAGKVHIG